MSCQSRSAINSLIQLLGRASKVVNLIRWAYSVRGPQYYDSGPIEGLADDLESEGSESIRAPSLSIEFSIVLLSGSDAFPVLWGGVCAYELVAEIGAYSAT
jgi:hypothetical protein